MGGVARGGVIGWLLGLAARLRFPWLFALTATLFVIDREMEIRSIRLLAKSGGRSGNWRRGSDGGEAC